eukprot:CAMPEP_0167783768 /NCGR_PEP_ID=MMETSP0111_2-20121227/7254_1 /TAXON_ID=91324 /ORGANISM="Lotharella globosa, Strain CCCM811" /LENGTH=272 /DNA_ID=CAMNT_0007674743 /DNA_START=228 /DNA_END=1046 /DNA_ORIENTATION=-
MDSSPWVDLHDSEEQRDKFYQFKANDIYGQPVYFGEQFQNLCIIVNVASRSGLAQQEYKKLNDLYEKYKPYGLEIFAFPCDNFHNCPDDEEALLEFHEEKMKAKFPLMEKISVNPNPYDEEVGPNTSPPYEHPLYTMLKNQTDGLPIVNDFLTKFIILPGGRIWRFNDRLIFRTITLEQWIRRKWGYDTDSTATTPQPETDSEHEHRKVEDCGANWPLLEGLNLDLEVGKDYGDPLLKKIIKAGRWPFRQRRAAKQQRWDVDKVPVPEDFGG